MSNKKLVGSVKYYVGKFLGAIEGENTPEYFKQALLDDVKRAKMDLRVFSSSTDLAYWDKSVVNLLVDNINNNHFLEPEFIVEKGASNPGLEKLAKEGKIRFNFAIKTPPIFNLRIVNGWDTYVSELGSNGQPGSYCWTFGNVHALRDRAKTFQAIKHGLDLI